MKAWGPYAKMIDPRMLQTIRNSSADSPSPAMLELRGKVGAVHLNWPRLRI